MSSLNLSDETIRGIHALGDLPASTVGALSTALFTILLKKPAHSEDVVHAQDLGGLDERTWKFCFSSLLALAVEGAKLGTSGAVLSESLEEFIGEKTQGLGPFFALYDKSIVSLRAVLQQSSWHLPHVVDADWRLDYVVRDSSLHTFDKPNYFISLKTESQRHFQDVVPFDVAPSASHGKVASTPYQTIDFSCSLQQMEDLLDTLKDAVKQAERLQANN